MTSSQRHSQPRELRVQRAINVLYRLYVMRKRQDRSTAHLVARCGLLNRAYLDALDARRTAAETAFAAP